MGLTKMENVKNKILYHVNTLDSKNIYPPIKVGDTLKVGENFNPYRGGYEIGCTYITDKLNDCYNAAITYWHYTIESVFEEERIKLNNKLPSRYKSLWLSDLRNLGYWEMSTTKNKKTHHKNFEVLVTGKLLKVDGSFVEGGPMPLITVRERARRYWTGEIINPDKVEYLFEGIVEVRKEINLISSL
jgi:hypothetical protein